jgi:hypothetical protein
MAEASPKFKVNDLKRPVDLVEKLKEESKSDGEDFGK